MFLFFPLPELTKTLPLDLFTFLRFFFLPSLVVIAINLGVFFLLYRRHLTGHVDIRRLPGPEQAVKHQAYFGYTCGVLALLAMAYVIASATQFPLSLVALAGSIFLLIGALLWKRTTLPETGKRISWSIFGFIAGMVIVVRSIEDTGLTAATRTARTRNCKYCSRMASRLGDSLSPRRIRW